MKFLNLIPIFIIFFILTLFNIYISFSGCYNSNEKKFLPYFQKENNFRKIIFITPTYARAVQEAELTRLAQTLLLVPRIHWILIEDSAIKTKFVTVFLQKIFSQKIYDFNYTHLNVETPQSFKTNSNDPNWLKPRGVWQRNQALKWLRENVEEFHDNSIVYFGDDDNTYDVKLFKEMQTTTKVSVFPVGLVGGMLVEKPLVKNDKVIGFNSIWKPQRKYPIDMSAFAINLKLLINKKDAYFSANVPRGYQETYLLNLLIQGIEELEPKADSCNEVLVWHTRTQHPKLKTKTLN